MYRLPTIRIATGVKQALDGLDARLAGLGRFWSTAVLTGMAVGAALPLHVFVRLFEGLPVQPVATVNLACEIALIAAPIIFYARDVIAQLNASKARLDQMTRQLAVAAEEAQNANRAKSAFLANMSHELRTPLNAIMGFSEVMKEQHLGPLNNPRYLGYAGDIHASGRYLLGIINDILDHSKIEAGKMSLDSAEEFPLRQAVDSSLAMVTPLADKFGVRIESHLPGDSACLVAVERMVRQILINLVGNAIKFTPAGGLVTIHAQACPAGYQVMVEDSGIGMSEAEICQALTPFGQVENKMTATHTGTGLGLPLAKAMMELHGGTLAVASRPHHGTCITLTFPADRISYGARAAA